MADGGQVGPARVVIASDRRHPYVGTAVVRAGVVTVIGRYRGTSGPREGAWSWPVHRIDAVTWGKAPDDPWRVRRDP